MADAHGSGPCESNLMRVQVPSPARFYERCTKIALIIQCKLAYNCVARAVFVYRDSVTRNKCEAFMSALKEKESLLKQQGGHHEHDSTA